MCSGSEKSPQRAESTDNQLNCHHATVQHYIGGTKKWNLCLLRRNDTFQTHRDVMSWLAWLPGTMNSLSDCEAIKKKPCSVLSLSLPTGKWHSYGAITGCGCVQCFFSSVQNEGNYSGRFMKKKNPLHTKLKLKLIFFFKIILMY